MIWLIKYLETLVLTFFFFCVNQNPTAEFSAGCLMSVICLHKHCEMEAAGLLLTDGSTPPPSPPGPSSRKERPILSLPLHNEGHSRNPFCHSLMLFCPLQNDIIYFGRKPERFQTQFAMLMFWVFSQSPTETESIKLCLPPCKQSCLWSLKALKKTTTTTLTSD